MNGKRAALALLLLLLAAPMMAQYNIKKLMDEGRRSLDQGYYVVALQDIPACGRLAARQE